jgi:hypothetical protein
MKKVKILIVLIILISVSLAQFTSGVKNIGGTISYMKLYYDNESNSSSLTIAPSGGYFLRDNFAITASINKVSITWDSGNDSETMNGFGFGIGAKYFMNNIYGGGSYMSHKWGDDDAFTQLLIEAGYLYGLNEYVYLDFGLDYNKGLGDNENRSSITIGVGIATFFK